ncbi:hypothetical protein M9H77_03987 [Catharanthus roseus]|uniref:Uncharacterized protein n=1 Tax=Catharanthus roseus TaxID=4058 RepID=A0ACC0CCT2_CATRO|nr:hypothetical protein M9H77_03987 [Catharanthus roseus]
MKQSLRNRFGVGNHEGQRQGQAKEKIMESSMGEKSTKANKLSQAQDILDRKNSISILELLNYNLWNKVKSWMKAKGEGMGKELSIGFENTSLSLYLNPFLLYHEFSFKELKLFLAFYAFFVTLVRNVMVSTFTCDLTFDIDHMLKCSSPCAYFVKQLLVNIARIKPSYHDLELLHDNLFFDLLVADFSSFCASMWSRIHIFFGSSVESGYDERVSWFPWSLYSDFHAKFKGELVENCDYESSFLYAFMQNFDGLYNEFSSPPNGWISSENNQDHALSLIEKKKRSLSKYILFKDHDAIDVNNLKLAMERLVFDPGGWAWCNFGNNRLPSHHMTKGSFAYLEEALKSKIEGFEGQKQVTKLFSMCSISKDQTREQLEKKMAKSWKGATLPPIVALGLPSFVGLCRHNSEGMTPTADGRFYPIIAERSTERWVDRSNGRCRRRRGRFNRERGRGGRTGTSRGNLCSSWLNSSWADGGNPRVPSANSGWASAAIAHRTAPLSSSTEDARQRDGDGTARMSRKVLPARLLQTGPRQQKSTSSEYETLSGKIEKEWILDSGCSHHMTGRKAQGKSFAHPDASSSEDQFLAARLEDNMLGNFVANENGITWLQVIQTALVCLLVQMTLRVVKSTKFWLGHKHLEMVMDGGSELKLRPTA